MSSPLSQDEAVTPATVRFEDVGQDLFVAPVVLGQGAMDARDGARYGQVDVFLDPEPRRVNHEDRAWPVGTRSFEGVRVGVFEGVSNWPKLESDEVVESVSAVGGGGEPEPVSGGDCANCGLEPGRGHVMTLVDDDEAIAAE